MDLSKSRVLVTGGAGLIGSHVVDQLLLENPKEIIVFDKNVSELSKYRSKELDYGVVTVVEGDIAQIDEVRDAINGVDYVIHTASLLTREASKDLDRGFQVNFAGTFNIIQACISTDVKKIIYSSSISIYGSPLEEPMTEEHPFNITSMYGAGKVTSEMLLKVYKRTKNLDYISLRYAVVYGPRQHFRGNLVKYIPESFERLAKGLPAIIYGDGSQPYDYIYVEDVARANILALKSPVSGEAFNIGTGITTTVKEVVQMILEITGINLEPIYQDQGDRFGLKSLFLDVKKADKLLDFKAKISLREGLTLYRQWLKERRNIEG